MPRISVATVAYVSYSIQDNTPACQLQENDRCETKMKEWGMRWRSNTINKPRFWQWEPKVEIQTVKLTP